jgi:hypothetical protein
MSVTDASTLIANHKTFLYSVIVLGAQRGTGQ